MPTISDDSGLCIECLRGKPVFFQQMGKKIWKFKKHEKNFSNG